MSGITIGIDLGTTNSCVGWFDNQRGAVEICPTNTGKRTLPSYVAFNDQQQLVGEPAVRQQSRNPTNTLYETKRFIGRTFAESKDNIGCYPYRVIDLGDDNVNFHVQYHGEDRVFCPEEIAAIILKEMQQVAEAYTGQSVATAVITVPAYFNDAQRQATRDAGRIAGLEVIRIINEPTAAAIAYGLDRKAGADGKECTVLVFDLGGGTFDTSILTVTSDGVFEVRAIAGDTQLGGADFDQRLMDYVERRYNEQYGVALQSNANPKLHRKLRTACEKAKWELSGAQRAEIELDGVAPDKEDFILTVTRAQFEEACDDLFKKCMDHVHNVIRDAGMTAKDIDDVVLVGGSTRVPRIQALLSSAFGGKELCKSINPDEAVAHGAAIQAAVLSADFEQPGAEEVPDIVLLDVCPLSLGVETTGGLMSVMISRNTIVPVKKSRLYSTTEDNQTSVTVSVFEGERSATVDNRLLGRFELEGIREAPRGTPKIRVSFELDADGIFTVTATDESELTLPANDADENVEADNNAIRTKVLTIQNNKGRLSENEVQKIVNDAQSNAARDALFTKVIRLKTEFENLLYGVRRTFSETATEILDKHADADTVKCVLDVVSEQFEWLHSLTDDDLSAEIADELNRRHDWVENDVARSVVDAVNQAIAKSRAEN